MMSLLRLLFALVTLTGLTLAQNSFSCANNDRTVITDSSGIQYILRCAADTAQPSFFSEATTEGFNACFSKCSSNCVFYNNRCWPCAAFTFMASGSGYPIGTGPGTCYYKEPASPGYSGFSRDGNSALVSAIKTQNYPPVPPAYQCPAQDLNVVTDPNTGYQYVLGCGRETYGGSQGDPLGVADSFNDCFSLCATFPGPGNCTAFTYSGGVNGVGSGTCYFKNVNSYWLAGSSTLVGGSHLDQVIRYERYSGSQYTLIFPTTTTTTSRVSSTTTTTSTTRTTTTTTSSSSRTSAVASSASRRQYCNQLFNGGPVVYCDM
ncbi:hypothetical protein AC578_4838 [Pseudocercospora eumusae]|uniref:Apple domain-containing protein n=1 Tax=Pseudocercospora eumusae TaxID=321146 RepID=A0A139GTU2_9PEZI|nr:hypothetical protein AC578_4838 [Pseudocercospora eumusae]